MSPILAERLADRVDAIVGVDTHTDTHTAAVVSPVGSVLVELTVAATADGVAALLAWAGQHTDGLGSGRRAWALDSARSHGVGLLRALRAVGETVFEAPKPTASARRRGGKSDSLDAVHAARAVLAAEHAAAPRPSPRLAPGRAAACQQGLPVTSFGEDLGAGRAAAVAVGAWVPAGRGAAVWAAERVGVGGERLLQQLFVGCEHPAAVDAGEFNGQLVVAAGADPGRSASSRAGWTNNAAPPSSSDATSAAPSAGPVCDGAAIARAAGHT